MLSWGKIVKAVLVSLALTLAALGVSKLNLFGFESVADAASDDVFQRITAGGYGRDHRGQDLIRIVHIDDGGLQALGSNGWSGWPPGYANLAFMIDDVVHVTERSPRAVFADLIIMGQSGLTPAMEEEFATLVETVGAITVAETWAGVEACRADPLTRLACIVEAGGTPVILARPDPIEQAGFTDVQRRLDGVALLAPVLVHPRRYPMASRYGNRPDLGVHGFDLSPAAALYAAHCLVEGREGRAVCGPPALVQAAERARALLAGNRTPTAAAPPPEWTPRMAVLWGDRLPSNQRALIEATSTGPAPQCRDNPGVLTRLFEQAVADRGAVAGERQACPYALNLGYDRLVAGFGLDDAAYDAILSDRLVLIGSHLRNSDWAPTPLHGQLPGVHYHAMALDNLVQLDGAYRRVDEGFLTTDDLLKSGLSFVLLLIVILAVMIRNTVLEHLRPQWNGRPPLWATVAYYGLLILLMIGVALAATWLASGVLRQAVINWLGVLALAFGALILAVRKTFIEDLGLPLGWLVRLEGRLEFDKDTLVKPSADAAPAPPDEPAPPAQSPPQEAVQ